MPFWSLGSRCNVKFGEDIVPSTTTKRKAPRHFPQRWTSWVATQEEAIKHIPLSRTRIPIAILALGWRVSIELCRERERDMAMKAPPIAGLSMASLRPASSPSHHKPCALSVPQLKSSFLGSRGGNPFSSLASCLSGSLSIWNLDGVLSLSISLPLGMQQKERRAFSTFFSFSIFWTDVNLLSWAIGVSLSLSWDFVWSYKFAFPAWLLTYSCWDCNGQNAALRTTGVRDAFSDRLICNGHGRGALGASMNIFDRFARVIRVKC